MLEHRAEKISQIFLASSLASGGLVATEFSQRLTNNTPIIEAANPNCLIRVVMEERWFDDKNGNRQRDEGEAVKGPAGGREVLIRAMSYSLVVRTNEQGFGVWTNPDGSKTTKADIRGLSDAKTADGRDGASVILKDLGNGFEYKTITPIPCGSERAVTFSLAEKRVESGEPEKNSLSGWLGTSWPLLFGAFGAMALAGYVGTLIRRRHP